MQFLSLLFHEDVVLVVAVSVVVAVWLLFFFYSICYSGLQNMKCLLVVVGMCF